MGRRSERESERRYCVVSASYFPSPSCTAAERDEHSLLFPSLSVHVLSSSPLDSLFSSQEEEEEEEEET